MATNETTFSGDYVKLRGSERHPSKEAKLLGPADEGEKFKVTIVLRRRTDGEPMPDFDYYTKTPLSRRRPLDMDTFAKKYGAHPDDTANVIKFAERSGLRIEETHAARRTVVASGTVSQMNKAFGVKLGRYQHTVMRGGKRKATTETETYRGRDGDIYVPKGLDDIIVGVFGLDNRNVTKRNGGDPPNTSMISVQTVTQLYNFPSNSAAGQTIAIFSEEGYQSSDISATFGGSPPTVTDVTVDASNSGAEDPETTQDICISAAAAPGASIAVYFTTFDQAGWVDLVQRVVHPNAGDPRCSVLSSSFYVLNSDDSSSLSTVSKSWIDAVTMAFEDAAVQGVTICIASGDTGSDSKIGDGKTHVQYPASDPWVLSVGGTTVGNVAGNTCDEYVWNDSFSGNCFGGTFSGSGATGGGISGYFPLPSYQNGAGVPGSLNDGHIGRGVPDVAANASPNSGYPITVGGLPCVGNGTSASAPLWAGLIAVLNAALGENVGFINPYIYQFGSAAFKDILGAPGPVDNAMNGAPGYPANAGWDACTGWGSPDGVALLAKFENPLPPAVYISGGYQSPDIVLTDLTTGNPVPIGGAPGGPWDTLLKPNTNYGFSAVVHNDSDVPANDIVVTFWAIPGGVGTNGNMVGSPQMVATIPAFSSVTVNSPTDFTSAPVGDHLCAVVSIYSSATRCTVNATTALQIPDPGQPGAHACSAWRNTDSTLAAPGSRFSFPLGLGRVVMKQPEPIVLKFNPIHIPVKWAQNEKVRELEKVLNFVGAKNSIPLYLLPEIKRKFTPLPLKTRLAVKDGAKIEEKGPNQWHILPNSGEQDISFEVTGEIPANAKPGDVVLMNITAQYPNAGKGPARSIDFLEVIHVK